MSEHKTDKLEVLTSYLQATYGDGAMTEELVEFGDSPATIKDVIALITYMQHSTQHVQTSLIEHVQIQDRLLDKLGATEEMREEVTQEYLDLVEQLEEDLKSKEGEKTVE